MSRRTIARYCQKSNVPNCSFMDIPVKLRKSDEDLAQEMKKLLNGQPIGILQSLDVEQRNKIIEQIKGFEGVT